MARRIRKKSQKVRDPSTTGLNVFNETEAIARIEYEEDELSSAMAGIETPRMKAALAALAYALARDGQG